MYSNPYTRQYGSSISPQNMYDQIDNQINQLQQMREQIKNNAQQPAINQTFQLAPNGTNTLRYANTIEDVNKEIVYGETPFFSQDMSILWIKNTKGNVKTYELTEILPKDNKDIQIELLQQQIEELKGMINNESTVTNANAEQNTTNTTANDEPVRATTKASKSTSISRVSKSKGK